MKDLERKREQERRTRAATERFLRRRGKHERTTAVDEYVQGGEGRKLSRAANWRTDE